MEIKHLRLIKAIDEQGSLTAAAEKLCLSQSALSHQLKELEEYFGTALYSRAGKKLIPTPAGRKLIERAKILIADLEKTVEDVRSINKGEFGTLRICMECYSSYFWLPVLVKSFHDRFPNVRVEVDDSNSKAPANLILNGKIDLALVIKRDQSASIQYSELFRDQIVVAFPTGHEFEKRGFVEFEEINGQTLVTHSNVDEIHKILETDVWPYNFRPKKILHVGVTDALVEIVRSGLGVAIVSEWALRPMAIMKGLSFRPLTKQGLFRNWYLAKPKSDFEPLYLNFFETLLRSEVVFDRNRY